MRKRLLWGTAILAGAIALLWLAGLLFLPGEYRFGTDVVMAKDPERAWAWFVNPAHWPARFSIVQSVEGPSGTMADVGTRHRVTLRLPGGRTLVSDIIVTDAIAGRLFADRHVDDRVDGWPLPLERVTDRLEFNPDGTGKTRIVFTEIIDVEGAFGKWLAYLELNPVADRVIAEVVGDYNRAVAHGRPVSSTPEPRA